MEKLVSVIIPTFNRASDLKRALTSVINQTYSNWEVLIVDNHSQDNTDEVIFSFNDKRIKTYKIHNNGVIAASRNLGIKHANGEFVAFLDSDDWWKRDKLKASVLSMEQGADIVYHEMYLVTKPHQKYFFRKTECRNLRKPILDDLLINGNALNNSSVVVRKELLNQINGLSENSSLVTAEDYNAWVTLAKLTDKFVRIPKTLGFLWVGGGNTTSNERTIRSIDEFELIHSEDYDRLKPYVFCWSTYIKGRLYYLMRLFDKASQNLIQIKKRNAPFLIRLKSYWMLFVIKYLSR